jgi:hypothetical protein
MPENLFKTQLIILGLVDHTLDALKVNQDRSAAREHLLAAIQATCTSDLLEDDRVSVAFRKALARVPRGSSLNLGLRSMQDSLDRDALELDLLPVLKKAARATLQSFVAKANRTDLSEMIAGALV